MSIEAGDIGDGVRGRANQLLARAAAADARAQRRLAVAIDDFFLPDDKRLDDRTRAAIAALIGDLVETVEGEIGQHAARLLVARGEPGVAAALSGDTETALDRLVEAGLLRDGDLMRELLARVGQGLLADALPQTAPDDPDRPSLLARLVDTADGVVAAGAMAVLVAASRRGTRGDQGAAMRTDLPAELHHRFVWWVAAVLRERLVARAPAVAGTIDRALAEAALRSLAAHDEGERIEAAALRLAVALDPQPGELATLLIEALADRQVALFIALLAHALGLSYDATRDVVLDPGADRLWLTLRALDLDRATIAGLGVALCEADRRRDLAGFVEGLDSIVALAPEAARVALAPLKLHPDYRAAMLALARGSAR